MAINTLVRPNLPVLSPEEPTAELVAAIPPEREAQLRRLLDDPYGPEYGYGNYEYALESGLVDLFYYDQESGEDGLVHVLSGVVRHGPNGAMAPEGFHHEPSAPYGSTEPDKTKVDRTHLEGLRSDKRRFYQEYPFEPYMAHVDIGGARKVSAQVDDKTGQTIIVETKNNMFPKEYDALAVLQAIRLAWENQDEASKKVQPNGKVVVIGYAPMIDGESLMKIRLVLDPVTHKIKSAYPTVKLSGVMRLSEQAVDEALGLR
jgi:hypothetical protein